MDREPIECPICGERLVLPDWSVASDCYTLLSSHLWHHHAVSTYDVDLRELGRDNLRAHFALGTLQQL